MKKSTTYIALIIGAVVLINILSDKISFRLDFTEDNRYSLSDATEDILENLDETVTITAYFSDNLPPDYEKVKRDFKEMLIEYENLSGGNVQYEFINPNEDEEIERKAAMAGIQPVLINVREKDQVSQQKSYLGALIQLGENSEAIPLLNIGSAMEYALSSNIKKLSVSNKPRIALLQGHGEAEMASLREVISFLNVLYDVIPVTLSDSTNELGNYSTLAIVAPKDTIPYSHLQQLDMFLGKGGKLFIACNRVEGDFQTVSGSSIYTGLEDWLNTKGLTVENNFIIDSKCASITVQQQQAFFTFNSQVQFPFLPIISTFEKHPITEGLEGVIMQFASSITYNGDTSLQFTPFASSSKKSGTLDAPLRFDINKKWNNNDFRLSKLTVGAILSGKIVGNMESKIVLIADGDFPVGGSGQQQQRLNPDNISLMANSIDWLSDDTGLIELRTKGVISRPIETLEDETKAILKYLNFLLPILLIVIYGIIRMQRKRNQKIKRMQRGYIY